MITKVLADRLMVLHKMGLDRKCDYQHLVELERAELYEALGIERDVCGENKQTRCKANEHVVEESGDVKLLMIQRKSQYVMSLGWYEDRIAELVTTDFELSSMLYKVERTIKRFTEGYYSQEHLQGGK